MHDIVMILIGFIVGNAVVLSQRDWGARREASTRTGAFAEAGGFGWVTS
jgi:hypothetical protein